MKAAHRASTPTRMRRWIARRRRSVPLAATLAPYALPHAPIIGLAALLVVAGTGVRLLRPWPLKYLFDDVLIPGSAAGSAQGALLVIVAAVVAIAVLDNGLGLVRTNLLNVAGQRVASGLRMAVYRQIQRLSLAFHDRQKTGELLTTVTRDVDKVQELLTGYVIDGASNALALIGMLAVMLFLDWQLTAAMVLLLPILALASLRYQRRMRRVEQDVRRYEGDIASLAQQTISAMRVVKAFGRANHEGDRFDGHVRQSQDANLRATRTEAAYGSAIDLLTTVALAGLIWFGARRVLSGNLSPGDLLVFITYIRDFYGPTRSLSKLGAKVARTRVRAEKIVEILRDEPAIADRPGATPAPPLRGVVRFENVSFSYLPGHPVLQDVSFATGPGQVVALVGPTGAGKSTIASLVGRLYEPTGGCVLIDGKDVRDYTLESLQSQISYVLQESVLFRASIGENIAYGRPEASQADIVAAARQAGAHDFVTELPEGYDTVVGERGATLSGGQRQRVAIARAIVRDAPILVLDEPTTGLDARAERDVLDALDHLMAGRTTVAIAHRLATIRRADLILIVDDGRIAEQGSHQELLAAGGRYAELWRLQVGDVPDLTTVKAPVPHPGRRPSHHSRQEATMTDPAVPTATVRPPPVVDDERSRTHDRDTLPEHVVRVLEQTYPLRHWQAWQRTPKGSSNTSFFVSTETGKYVLRRSNTRKTADGLEIEARLIEFLAAAGYPAPTLVRPVGGTHVPIEDRCYLMTSLLPGCHYDPANRRHLIGSAHALARYHRLVAGFPPPYPPAPTSLLGELGAGGLDVLEQFGRLASSLLDPLAMDQLRGSLDTVAGHVTRVRRALEAIVADLPSLVIQGSFGRSALLFVGDELTGVIDFDRAGLDLRVLDLAYTVKALCRAPGNRWVGLEPRLVGDFLQAYETVERLEPAERDALPLVFQAQRLLKVLKKCQNVVAKDELAPQEPKDVQKVVAVVDRERARVSWLEGHAGRLSQVVGGVSDGWK